MNKESRNNSILSRITVHTAQYPEMTFREFEYEEADGKTVLKAENEDVRLCAAVQSEDQVTAIEVSAALLKRENPFGFPDCFRRDNGLEIFLPMQPEGEFAAVYQHKAWWTRPAFGDRIAQVPEKTQLVIRRCGEEYEVLLAVCLNGLRTDLSGCEDGICIRVSVLRDNVKNMEGLAVVYGTGKDPYEILACCVERVKAYSNHAFRTLDEKSRPGFMEGIGWCTWDSLGQDVSEQAIFDKMEEFRRLGISVSYVLIDDGWSLVNRQTLKLRGLDADPERFPQGLASTVKTLKEVYHVKHVGVWQAFKGYWYGIEEGSPAHLQLQPYMMKYADGELTVRPTKDAAFGFWNCWHDSLRRAGIDFVKVDGQGSVPTMLRGDCSDDDAMRNLYAGLEASVLLNFDGNLINCMGMAPENVWNRTASALSRSSDDYTPKAEGSIVEHLLQNCFNNVWQGDLFLGDWDMFWSDHVENGYSACLRTLSGGPVYVSDPLGQTDRQMIGRLLPSDEQMAGRVLPPDEQMAGRQLPQDKQMAGRILPPDNKLPRCQAVARPTLDCLTHDYLRTGGILKIFNICDDRGYLGCFTWDVEGDEAVSTLRWEDIPARLPMPRTTAGSAAPHYEKPDAWIVRDLEGNTLGRCSRTESCEIRMPGRSAKLLEMSQGDRFLDSFQPRAADGSAAPHYEKTDARIAKDLE